MRIILTKSPIRVKKYRVTFPDGDTVDFGGKGYTDYTIHKDPMRMRLYVLRHGGGDTRKFNDPDRVHERMLRLTKSKLEDWGISGLKTAGFWSRWLLWSHPNMKEAIHFMNKTFKLQIKYK